jgi:cyclophilin family peptidyl-prolyl cis-trans isomerase
MSTPDATEADKPKDGEEVAVIETNLGKIVVQFFPDKAPGHVKNFKDLAKKGFYDGTLFHRVIPGFMIQGGDPNTKKSDTSMYGTGGPGYQIKAEFNDTKHVAGILSMARSSDPDSAGSQFFIMVGTAPHLDGNYSAFGKVVTGMDVVKKIEALPTNQRDLPTPNKAEMKKVTIVTWPIK